jgi:hypothetical protein
MLNTKTSKKDNRTVFEQLINWNNKKYYIKLNCKKKSKNIKFLLKIINLK